MPDHRFTATDANVRTHLYVIVSHRVIPARKNHQRDFWRNRSPFFASGGGGGRCWIRTSEGVSQQIYSLPPLATWVTYQPDGRAALPRGHKVGGAAAPPYHGKGRRLSQTVPALSIQALLP